MGRYQVHRSDMNAVVVIAAMREEGASVEPIGRPVDVAVSIDGQECLAEIKTITGKLRPSQVKFWARWQGRKAVLRSTADGRALVAALKADAVRLKGASR